MVGYLFEYETNGSPTLKRFLYFNIYYCFLHLYFTRKHECFGLASEIGVEWSALTLSTFSTCCSRGYVTYIVRFNFFQHETIRIYVDLET
jgi:hypothetical protein